MSTTQLSRGKKQRRRLHGLETLERRDVVGEWLVGLAGVGLAATAEARRWDSEPIAEGSSATVELGTSVDRGLACIVPDSARRGWVGRELSSGKPGPFKPLSRPTRKRPTILRLTAHSLRNAD